MTNKQQKGYLIFQKRLKNKEFRLCQTDKTTLWKLTTMTFLIMGGEHTKKDEEFLLDIVICLQKDSDKHTSMLITFFDVGCSEKEKTRYRENSLKQQNIAPVELLIRDHKKPDENGKLKTCPVANGSAFSRSGACEILSVIIDDMIKNRLCKYMSLIQRK